MAYSEIIAERIRDVLVRKKNIEEKKVMCWRLSIDEALHSDEIGALDRIGSNPPQKPQPIFADFWYLGNKMRCEQSRVTSCHFF
jgi:hypothetical protein